jgi:DNA-directed RNA polymerase specialized sigma24 family protein
MFRVISDSGASSAVQSSVAHNVYPPATDEFLAVATAAGDSAAFNVLLERNESYVRSIVRGVIGCPSEAEDIAQDVFIGAWNQIQTYQPRYSFRSWLGRIAVNLAINAVRQRGRRLRPPLLSVGFRSLDSSRGRWALAQCPAREAKALAMRYLADFSYAEIGEALALTGIAARILVWRGLKQLRKFNEDMPHRG